jgi:4-carboxymuconolactone decarboxylase
MRLPPYRQDSLTPPQRAVWDATVAGKRGSMPPPTQAWLGSPEFAMRGQHLGEYIRFDTCFGPQWVEIAILVTAKFWRAQYEWWAHRRLAEQAGLDAAIIDAIRDGREPPIADPRARVIYDYATTLHRDRAIPDALHARMLEHWGERGAIDAIGTCGYYAMVAMTLNAYQVPLPDGAVSELP